MSPADKERLSHEQRKREIANVFTGTIQKDAYEEGAAEWIVAIIEGIIFAVIALLMLPEPTISKLVAILLTIVGGIIAALAIAYLLIRSKDAFVEAARVRDRDEDMEDQRHRQTLENLPH